MREGVIGRKVWDAVGDTWWWQILVPRAATKGLFQRYHGALGHLSAGRTEAALKRGFYWPKLGEDVKCWVAECPQCVQRKPEPEVSAPFSANHHKLPHEDAGY